MSNFSSLLTQVFNYKEPIFLREDITLESSESPGILNSTFKEGIEIKSDNVVIDGNGHTIDGKGKTRLFNVLGKNVILRNINFKNGFSKEYGGAIRVAGECRLVNCTFENNHAKKGGDDISNGSELYVCHCKFLTNSSNRTIHNLGKILVLDEDKEDLKALVSGGNVEYFIPQHKITFVLTGENVYLKNARVSMDNISACTNIRGICDIEGVEEGNHLISIEAENYKPIIDSINVSSENLIFPFILEKIIKKYNLKFFIHDERGPIEGAMISFGDRKGITDEKGELIFEDVKEGKILVTVNADGYESKTQYIFVEDGQTSFDMKLGALDKEKPPFHVENYNGPYIFTSYAHKDSNEVFSDLRIFHENGLDIWYDEGIESGSGWQSVIEKALLDCSLFIVFISPNAVESPHVREEIFLAIGEEIPVIPIYLEETELKYGLKLRIGSLQAIKKYDLEEDRYLETCHRDFKNHEFDLDLFSEN